MERTRRWIAVAVALAALAASPVRAQEDPTLQYKVSWLFQHDTDQRLVKLNGNASFVQGRLRLTGDAGQASSAFIRVPQHLSDYEASFTIEVRRVRPGETPGDGFMFLAQTAGPDRIGANGGGIGYTSFDTLTPPADRAGGGFPGYSYGVEFNSYPAQGLPNAAETAGINVFGLRTRLSQMPMAFVDQGFVRIGIRVRPGGLTVWAQTLVGSRLVYRTILESPRWMGGFFNPPAPLLFGFTAGTGGARQIVDIYDLTLRSNQSLQFQ